ncbi:MAG: hypothetical protein AB7G28_14485 [Pirellulales bacterium]
MQIDSLPAGFEFTPEQLRVLANNPDRALRIPVSETNKVYLLIEEGFLPTLDEEYIRAGLAHAAEQAIRGEEGIWDPAEIKAAGRALLSKKSP